MRPSLLCSASRSLRAEAGVSLLLPRRPGLCSQRLSLHTLHRCASPSARPCRSSALLSLYSPPQPLCFSQCPRPSALSAMQHRSSGSSASSSSTASTPSSTGAPSPAAVATSSPAPDAAPGSAQPSSSSPTSALADRQASPQSLWAYWTAESPAPAAFSLQWWGEQLLVLSVFAVTGSLSVWLVKPMLSSALGVSGSLRDGPWSYRLLCVAVLMPAYSLLLLTIGTAVGRHAYFKRVAMRMWGRLLPGSWKQRLAAGGRAAGGGGSGGIEQQQKLKQ